LAEMANLKAVLVGNVLFVTGDRKAAKLDVDYQKSLGLTGATAGGGQCGLGGALGLAGGVGGGGILGFGGGAGGGASGFVGGGMPATGTPLRIIRGPGAPGASQPSGDGKGKPTAQPGGEGRPTRQPSKEELRLRELRAKLAKPITLDKALDPQAPFKDVVAFIHDRYDLPLVVDREAFKTDLNQEVNDQPVNLPRMAGVRLGTVLEKLASQVQGTILVKPDHIAIVPASRARTMIWGQVEEEGPGRARPVLPLVQTGFDHLALEAALKELAEATGISVVIDEGRVGDQARRAVTASLTNVPLDTAVQLLADQAGLEAVLLDNVFYITTPANARLMRVEQQKVNQRGLESRAGPGPAGAAG